jgi:hypothetical protein
LPRLRGSLRAPKEEEVCVRDRLTPKLVLVRGLALAGVTFLVILAGCADQGEGERCTFFMVQAGDASINGSSDCASGLVCEPPPNTNTVPPITTTSAGTLGVCCPPKGSPVNSTNCQALGGGSQAPFSRDASTDGSADAAADAPTDARVDAQHPDAGHNDAGHDGGHDAHVADGAPKDAAGDATMGMKDAAPKDAATTDAPKDAATDAPKDAPHSG